MNNRDLTAVFWDTQGKIKYNTHQNFFNYETSMSINWNNKIARKVLINLMQIFSRPNIMNLNPLGIALWDTSNLKDLNYYDVPILFYEICIRDRYVLDKNQKYNKNYPVLECKYNISVTEEHINMLSKLHNYVQYDSFINMLTIRSITLEENLIILDLFLTLKIKTEEELIGKKGKVMEKLNKLTEEDFRHNMKLLIDNINSYKNDNNLYVNKNINYE